MGGDGLAGGKDGLVTGGEVGGPGLGLTAGPGAHRHRLGHHAQTPRLDRGGRQDAGEPFGDHGRWRKVWLTPSRVA
ncbi:hypothetical protein Rru_A2957 [Rhodospirillum rubrum ATCC 11170]|uniref:Uncharacterized protein n=1 Tax=Rhodospirillum rubrum (strain ATCC 11170 / ATH 1.1.1 / DSM 467 / LMG 4362 / NCIMB 8255 / S1) TaxID=269796 RepID=Q2RQ41_RHORT|nr:hypothetical protein Rru_A2957 [Rhodospirillum rubrum ATCC 11170]